MKENPFLGSVERNVEKNEDIKGFTDAEIAKVLLKVFMNSTIHRKGYQPNRLGITSSSFYVLMVQVVSLPLHLEDIYLYEVTRKEKICG